MRTISGRNGCVYALGDPFEFRNVPLHDLGTGWDWKAPEELSCWVPGELSFEVRDGEWHRLGAVEVHHRSGRASFGRCLSGMDVRASGTCLPKTFIGEGETWEIYVEAVVRNATTLGAEAPITQTRKIGASAIVRGVSDEVEGPVLTVLPMFKGSFVGVGKAIAFTDQMNVEYDLEGVSYDYC